MKKFLAFAFAAAALAGATLASGEAAAQDRRVRIINQTGVTMNEFYASNVNRNSWEEDILGRSVLAAGSSVVINIDDGSGACLFDFRAVFADGDVVERRRINVCEISEYRYTSR